MTKWITEVSPRLKARLAGVFYLLMMLTGGIAVSARGGLVVNGDAAATATNIMAHESSALSCAGRPREHLTAQGLTFPGAW